MLCALTFNTRSVAIFYIRNGRAETFRRFDFQKDDVRTAAAGPGGVKLISRSKWKQQFSVDINDKPSLTNLSLQQSHSLVALSVLLE